MQTKKHLYFEQFGTGNNTLIFLHGLLGMGQNWRSIAKQVSETFSGTLSAITLDLRNHGRSFHDPDHHYEDLAQDIRDFISQNQLQDVILCGHSMGGKVIYQLTQNLPANIKALGIFDILPIYYPLQSTQLIALQKLPLADIKSRSDAIKYLNTRVKNDAMAQFLAKNVAQSETGFRLLPNIKTLLKCQENIACAIKLKPCTLASLFLFGQNSEYLEPEAYQNLDAFFPNHTKQIIPQAGHWLHAQQPKAFLTHLISFLETQL